MHRAALRAAVLVLVAAGLLPSCIDIELFVAADVRALLLLAGVEHAYRFTAAAAGDPLTLAITTKKGSTADFTVTLEGPSGAIDLTAFAGTSDVPGTFTLTALPLPDAGDYRFTVAANAPIEYRMRFQAGTAKKPLTKIDLRPKKLGIVNTDVTYVGRRVGPQGATLSAPTNPADLMGAARVVVPAGAVASPTGVFFVNAAAPLLDDPAGQRAAGPAMRVGPDTLPFAQPLAVDVPIDAATIPPGADLLTAVRVLSIGRDKTRAVLAPSAAGENFVTVATTRGATLVAFIQRSAPRVEGGRYDEFLLDVELVPDGAGDSRVRRVTGSRAQCTFGGGGAYSERAFGATTEVSHQDDGDAVVTTTEFAGVASDGVWTADARTIDVTLPGARVLRHVADDGSVVVRGTGPAAGDSVAHFAVGLRQPTPATAGGGLLGLSGTFVFGALELVVRRESAGPAGLLVTRSSGTLTLALDFTKIGEGTVGTWTANVSGIDFDAAPGAETPSSGKFKETFGGTFAAETTEGSEGIALVLTQTGAGGPPIYVVVGADANELIGMRHAEPGSDEPSTLVFVAARATKGLVPAALAGDYAAGATEMRLTSYPVPLTPADVIADLATRQSGRTLRFSAGRAEVLALVEDSAVRDDADADGVLTSRRTAATEPSLTAALAKTGKLKLAGGPLGKAAGAMAPDLEFGFVLLGASEPSATIGLMAFVKSAP